MFERSYQPRHVRENLLSTVVPEAQAKDSAGIFKILRNSFLECDARAPINISQDKINSWKDGRKDMRTILESNDYKKSAQLRVLVKKLSKVSIAEQRKQYFEESNKRRVLGQSTTDLYAGKVKSRIKCSGESQAKDIGQWLKQLDNPVDDPDSRRKVAYMDMLVAYLRGTQQGVPTCFIWIAECFRLNNSPVIIANLDEWCTHVAAQHGNEHAPNPPAPTGQRQRYLLCNISIYNSRKHFQSKHLKADQFDKPFPCPECARQGAEVPYLVLDCNDWD